MPVSFWIRRSDQPRRPKALICSLFSGFKTLLTRTEDIFLSGSMSWLLVYNWPVFG